MNPFPDQQPEPWKTQRQEFSTKTKAQAFLRDGGRCVDCGCKLDPSNTEYDHDKPCALGGDNSLENCKCRCTSCHSVKTNGDDKHSTKHDKAVIAKTRRQYNKANGIKTRKKASIPSRPFPKRPKAKGKPTQKQKFPSAPMPGSKASGLKKHMDGSVSTRSAA